MGPYLEFYYDFDTNFRDLQNYSGNHWESMLHHVQKNVGDVCDDLQMPEHATRAECVKLIEKRTFELYEKLDLPAHVREIGSYLERRLDGIAAEFDCITARRGVGLMQGLVFDRPVGDIITKAMDSGLVLINAGTDIIRFVPPLIIDRQNVDDMTVILRESIREVCGGR